MEGFSHTRDFPFVSCLCTRPTTRHLQCTRNKINSIHIFALPNLLYSVLILTKYLHPSFFLTTSQEIQTESNHLTEHTFKVYLLSVGMLALLCLHTANNNNNITLYTIGKTINYVLQCFAGFLCKGTASACIVRSFEQ